MSRTTSIEITAEDLRPIELVPVGFPAASYQSSLKDKPTVLIPQDENGSSESLTNINSHHLSTWRAVVITGTISGVSLIGSMLGGIMIVSLPTMARDINLEGSLLLWPASVNALACGCTLLLSGSISDVVGGRKIYLIGTFFLVVTTVACGVCRTGIELILFRAAQGVALSLCLPSSVSLITTNMPSGTYRNIAFACLGAGQPIGFGLGLVLGGLFIQSIGWRYGYYIGAILIFVIWIISIFGIPKDEVAEYQSSSSQFRRIRTEIDWIGCGLLSTSLGMFSYVFSVLAGGTAHFLEPASLALFSIAVILIPIFGFYIVRQERLGRKVIIPPSLLRNRVFTSLCLVVFVMWGVFEAMMFFLTLFYQQVQTLSALQTSLRFLPMVVTGALTNFLTGYLVKRVRADILVFSATAVTAMSPLLMAIIDPSWSYWTCAFFATACLPVCADVLFTVAQLTITSVLPPKTHGLAGALFNTISDIGNSMGLALTAVVASAVTMAADGKISSSTPRTLMDGYRATFWVCLGFNILTLGVILFGLRKIGKVGIKTE